MDYQSNPWRLGEGFFGSHGISLSSKAKCAIAVGIGLAGTVESCDELFLSIGLRKSNSVLALLADKYRLDFSEIDAQTSDYFAARENAEIQLDLELFGYTNEEITSYFELEDDITDDDFARKVSLAREYEERSLQQYEQSWLGDQVLSKAVSRANAAKEGNVDTFQLLAACAEFPQMQLVLHQGKISGEQLVHECKRYQSLQASHDHQQIKLTFENGRIRVKTFDLLDGYSFDDQFCSPQKLILQLPHNCPFISKHVIDEFEDLINWNGVSENDIQRFLAANPSLLMGDSYKSLHSQLILENGDRGDLIPDFFAELTTDQYVDIVDLKLPKENLLVGKRNRRGFSAAVQSAIYQLRAYRDYFDDPARRNEFHSRFGLRAFRPKIAVIIGRTPESRSSEELREARRQLNDAEVITYDDIIERARRRQLFVSG